MYRRTIIVQTTLVVINFFMLTSMFCEYATGHLKYYVPILWLLILIGNILHFFIILDKEK